MFTRYHIIRTKKELKQLVKACEKTGIASVDFETNAKGLYTKEFKPTILSVSFQAGSGCSIPLQHFDESLTFLQKGLWLKWLRYFGRKVIENPKITKVAWNWKFDNQIFQLFGIYARGTVIDGMLAKYLLNEERPNDLKSMVRRYLPEFGDYEKYEAFETIAWEKKPLEPLCRYGCMDTDFTLRLSLFLEYKLVKLGFYNLYRNLLMSASRVLQEAEKNGLPFNLEFNDELQIKYRNLIDENTRKLRENKKVKKFEKRMIEKRKEAYIEKMRSEIEELSSDPKKARSVKNREDKISRVMAGEYLTNDEKKLAEPLNFNSQKQMVDLLYTKDGFNFPILEYTVDKFKKPTNTPSTAEDVLIKLKAYDKTDFVENLLTNRGLEKMNSTYIVNLRELVQGDNCVHPTFLIHGTTSGRLSSRNPNGQNIPKTMVNPDIKKQFITPPGKLFLTYDYSQAELRILAHLAKEDTMLEWFRTGKDIHLASACKKYHEDYDKILPIYSDEQHPDYPIWKKRRKQSKTINFGICLSGDTSILTEKGWQRFDYLEKGIKVAQYDQVTGEIDFVKPTKYIEHKDQRLYLHESKCTNICATDNHRLLLKSTKNGSYYNEVFVKDANHKKGYFPSAGQYKGNFIDDKFTRFIAMVASDGNFFRPGIFRFCFKKDRKIERLEKFLSEVNLPYKKRVRPRYTTFHVDTRSTDFEGVVERYLSSNKDLDISAIHHLNGYTYLDEVKFWDGTIVNKTNQDVVKFSTKSLATAKVMQIFGVLNDRRITLTKVKGTYRLHWRLQTNNVSYARFNFKPLEGLHTVYCVEVPKTNIIISRNGRVTILKNCYEQSAPKLAESLSTPEEQVPVEEAQIFLDEFFETFPNIKKFIDKQHKFMGENGYCVSLFGRRRRCPKVYSDKYGEYLEALRQATNAPVQSAASDMALFASVIVYEKVKKGELPPMTEVNTVHDSVYQFIEPKYITPDTVYKIWDICRNPSTKKFFGFAIKDVNMSMDFTVGRDMAEELPYIPGYDYNKMLLPDFDLDEYYAEHRKVKHIEVENYPEEFKSYFSESWRLR